MDSIKRLTIEALAIPINTIIAFIFVKMFESIHTDPTLLTTVLFGVPSLTGLWFILDLVKELKQNDSV